MASTWSKLVGSLGRLRQGQNPPKEPWSFPTSGFSLIDQSRKVEEEELPDYAADRFYPGRLGEVFHDQYHAVAKLGFGSSSTIWLARDLSDHRYVALKVYVVSVFNNWSLRRANWLYFGGWLGLAHMPPGLMLKELEARLEDPSRFVAFLQKVLRWVPEERPTAKEMLQDPCLRG